MTVDRVCIVGKIPLNASKWVLPMPSRAYSGLGESAAQRVICGVVPYSVVTPLRRVHPILLYAPSTSLILYTVISGPLSASWHPAIIFRTHLASSLFGSISTASFVSVSRSCLRPAHYPVQTSTRSNLGLDLSTLGLSTANCAIAYRIVRSLLILRRYQISLARSASCVCCIESNLSTSCSPSFLVFHHRLFCSTLAYPSAYPLRFWICRSFASQPDLFLLSTLLASGSCGSTHHPHIPRWQMQLVSNRTFYLDHHLTTSALTLLS